VNALPPLTTLLSLSQAVPSCPERRDDGRELTMLRIGCLLFDDRRELCLIRNISGGGALVRTYSHMTIGQRVAIELNQGESVAGVIRWCESNMIGIMFNHPLDVVQLLANSADWPRPRQPRVEVQALARIHLTEGTQIAQVLDLSQGGVKVRATPGLTRNRLVTVEVRDLPPLQARIRWSHNDVCGLAFAEPLALKTLVRWVREQQAGSVSPNAEGAAA
jgi:hypothetical protein